MFETMFTIFVFLLGQVNMNTCISKRIVIILYFKTYTADSFKSTCTSYDDVRATTKILPLMPRHQTPIQIGVICVTIDASELSRKTHNFFHVR